MIRINLLPVRVSKKKTIGKQQLVLFGLVIVLGFVLNFLWASSRAGELATREAKVKSLHDEISQLDKIIGEVKNIKDQQAALREKLDILQQLKANRSGPVRVLDALAQLTPKRLWLTRMEEKGGVVTYAGTATTIDDVSEFMSALKSDPHFGAVELGKTSAKMEKNWECVEFTVTASLSYAPKPPGAPAQGAAAAPAPAGQGR
jgi:type IV pilus assembly protein PilN